MRTGEGAAANDHEFDELLRLVCTRDLDAAPFPILHIGAYYSKRRDGETIAYCTLAMATGVTDEGELEPLGVAVGDSEQAQFWARFLVSLKVRGLHGVRVVAAAEHGGLSEAISAAFPAARFHLAESLEELAEDAPALIDLRFEGAANG